MLLQDGEERQPETPAGRHRRVAVHTPGGGVCRGEAGLPAAQDGPGRGLLREDDGTQEEERQAEGPAVGGGEGRGGVQQHGGHQLRKGEVWTSLGSHKLEMGSRDCYFITFSKFRNKCELNRSQPLSSIRFSDQHVRFSSIY